MEFLPKSIPLDDPHIAVGHNILMQSRPMQVLYRRAS
jgi:hypothetical protein